MALLTRRQWWMRVLLTVIAAWSMTTGLLAGFRDTLAGADVLLVLFATGVGSVVWRLAGPEPATASDVALIIADPAVAKALAREHNVRRLLAQGVLLGLTIGVAIGAVLVHWW